MKNYNINEHINTSESHNSNKPLIKICGLTNANEAAYLNENNVDFAGMVLFFPKSKRCISTEQASLIINSLNPEIKTVAVVVSPTEEQIQLISKTGFDYVQIHGTIPDNVYNMPVLKAFNVSDMDSYEIYHNDSRIIGYVFDALEPGSGKTFDWNLVTQIPRDEKLLLLAGGLNCDNVQSAISKLHPDGVDVSSGVENENGDGKDSDKIRSFVHQVRL